MRISARSLPALIARVVIFLIAVLLTVTVDEVSVSASNPIFLPTVGYKTHGAEVAFVTVADVNGDGFPDLLATNTYSSDTISVSLGNGDGTFGKASTYYSGGGYPSTIVPVDIDGDGHIDLLVANQASCYACSGDGTVAVLLNKGNGTFKPAVSYDAGGLGYGPIGGSKLSVVDVNGDGVLDAVVVNCLPSGFPLGSNGCGDGIANGVVGVLFGNGNGTFQAVVTYDVGGAGGGGSLAVGDLNGDNKPDLVISNACVSSQNCAQGSIGVLLNNGDGTFKKSVVYPTAGSGATGVLLADINGDGKLDILAGGCSTGNCWAQNGIVSIAMGKGDGTFGAPTAFDSGGRLADGLAVADVNGDGKLDIIVANVIDNSVGLLLGAGNSTFSSPQTFPSGGDLTYSVAIANLDGDGKPDVLASSCSYNNVCGGASGVVGVLLSYGPLTFTSINSSGSPAFVGQPVTFTAHVSSGTGIPNGDLVNFYDGYTYLQSVPLSNGMASFTTSSLKAGGHSIEALYMGDATHKRSSKRTQETISKYPTMTTLSSSLNPSTLGQAVTFTANVAGSGPPPTKKVFFFDGSTSIGATTVNGGVAKLTLSTLAAGTHSITARYVGDAGNAPSTSAVLSQVVN